MWNYCLCSISFTGYCQAEVSTLILCAVCVQMYMLQCNIVHWGLKWTFFFIRKLVDFIPLIWFIFLRRSFLFISPFIPIEIYVNGRALCIAYVVAEWWLHFGFVQYIEVRWIGTNRFGFCEIIAYIAYFHFRRSSFFIFKLYTCVLQYRCARITSAKRTCDCDFIFLYHWNHTGVILFQFFSFHMVHFSVVLISNFDEYKAKSLLFPIIIHWTSTDECNKISICHMSYAQCEWKSFVNNRIIICFSECHSGHFRLWSKFLDMQFARLDFKDFFLSISKETSFHLTLNLQLFWINFHYSFPFETLPSLCPALQMSNAIHSIERPKTTKFMLTNV